jgi:hypothetical protein
VEVAVVVDSHGTTFHAFLEVLATAAASQPGLESLHLFEGSL